MRDAARSGYSLSQIVLHWAIAFLVLSQLVLGDSMSAVTNAIERGTTASAEDVRLATLHYWFGIAVLVLVVARLALRLNRGAPAPIGVTPLAARIAAANHALFYVLLVVVPILGLLAYYFGDPWGMLHSYAKPVFIVLILVHAGAALFHQFWVKDGTLRRMLTPRPA